MRMLAAIISLTRRWSKSKSLAVFVTMIVIAGVWITVRMEKAKTQQETVESLARLGVKCYYDYETVSEIDPKPVDGPWPGLSGDNLGPCPLADTAQPPGPAWLRTLLGVDFLSNIVAADASGDRGLGMLKEVPRLSMLRIRDWKDTDWEHGDAGLPPDGGGTDCDVTDSGLMPIRELKHLQLLEIQVSEESSECITDAVLEPIRHLAQLRVLRIKCHQISDAALAPLADLRDLRQLVLECPQINGSFLRDIRGLTKLVELDLFGVRLTDTHLENIKALHHLERLYLSQSGISDAGLMHLEGLIQLQYLDVSSCPISDAGLAHLGKLANLKVLVLNDTQVTDEGLEHLKGLSQLRVLALLRTSVTDSAVKLLRQALPNCEVAPAGVAEL